MKKRAFLALVAFTLVGVALAHADLYKWTDAHGVVHFSNTPPPSDKGAAQKIFEEKKQTVQPAQSVEPPAKPAVPSKGAESAYRALKKVEGLVEAGTRRPLVEIGKSINFDSYNNALVPEQA